MNIDLTNITFKENGLIPAIVQDVQSKEVLMLAYMNEEALQKTINTKETWFYSRSRNELWNKGETSGNKQRVHSISYDCDGDTLLVQVNPLGPACHTGENSCFFNPLIGELSKSILPQLVQTIKERRKHQEGDSYTSYMFREGLDKILKEVGEETSEVIIGAKNKDKQELTWEIADLTYHTLVLMELLQVDVQDITAELSRRHVQKEGK